MFKNSMSTLVLPANFHTSSENCIDFRDSLSIDSNLPSLPPVTKWNYEDTTEYISNIDIKNTVSNLINDQSISQHIVNQYHTAQSLLNCSKQSLPTTVLPFGDSGCISLTDETSLISVKHSTSTPVHTMDSDSTPTTNASSTNTISPINIDSLDRSNEVQAIPVMSNKTDQSLQPMIDDYYTSINTISTTTTTTTAINNANPVINITTTTTNNNNDNSSSTQSNEQQNVGLIYYSEENQTPVIKQTVEHKRNWNTPVMNSVGVMNNQQQDELNLDESPSDNELNLSSESMNRRNRADVKIQPYALRGNVEVFRCPLCSQDEIFSRGHLTNHLQDHQSNFKRDDYKHVCCFCFSELSSNSSLERHLLTHTNHRPFNCNLCDKAFTTNGNLSRHIRTSHQVKTTATNSFTPISTAAPSISTSSSSPSSSAAPQLVSHHTSHQQHHHHYQQQQQQQPILLPNWFQSSTSLQSTSSSSTNIYPKLTSVYQSGVNDACCHQNSSSSSSIKQQLDFNTSRINTSQKLTTTQSSHNEMLKIRHDYTPLMNLSTSAVYPNDKHIDVIDIKSCMNNLSHIIPTFIINEPIKLEQTKSTLSAYDLHEQKRDNHSEEMEMGSSTSLYTENKNFTDWSTCFTKHQEQHHIDDNVSNKTLESSSWSTYNNKGSSTSEFLQFFSNYWLSLSKNGALNNSAYTSSVDPRTIIASLLPSFLPVNNTMNNDFTSVTMMSSLSTSTSSSSAAAAGGGGANDPVDTIGNFSKYTSESPRITICEIPSHEMDNQVDRRFDGSLYTASSGEYVVVSSSPNPNVQNNNNGNSNNSNNSNLQVIRPKFFTGTNKHERQKSRIKKVRSLKTFSVRYILAKRRKSLTMIGKKKLSRKVADIKFRSLSSLSSSSKQRRECDMQQFQSVDAEYSSNRSHSSCSPDHCNSTRNNSNYLSADDYTCSLSNFFSISDRPSPSAILYTYNDKMINDNENNNNDNTMLNTTEQNYLQPMESYPEILDLSLRNKNLQTYEESQKNTNDIQQFNRLYANPGNYSDMNSKPRTFTPMNASTALYPSYAVTTTTNTAMPSQPTVDTKSFGHEIDLNNILHDICSLSVIQRNNKTSAYTDNLTNTTGTTNNQLSRLSMNLQNNMPNANKILSLRSNIPPVLIQPKKNSYKDAPKLITCPISGCNQKFPWNSSLKRHILTHTPHKPFACTRCTKSFSTKSNRERHMERVHRVSLKRQRQRFNRTSMSIQSPSSGDNRSELSGHHSNMNSVGRTTTATTTTTTTTATLGDNNDQEIDGIEELREDEILSMNSNEKQAEDISNSLLIRAGDPVVEPNPERLYNAALLAVANSTRGGFTNFLNHVSSPSIISNNNNTPQNILPNISIRQRQSSRGGGGGRRRPRRSNLLSMKSTPQIPLIDMITESTSENKSTYEDPPIDLSLHSTMKNTPATLTCPICSLSIGSRCFRRHLTLHQVDNPVFRCHLCQLTFQDQITTLTHWAMEHSNEWSKFVKKLNTNDTSTDILTQIQLSLKNNVNTTITTNNYNSSKCDLKETISKTINLSELKEPINYSAKLSTTTTTNNNNNHNHNNDSRYVSCCVCLHRFGSQQDLQRHMRSHTGERPFICPYCGKEFSLKHSMHRHARVHMKQTIKINTINETPS
ncbi:unnamed protein product [Trichobilharzia szidati]|nr:unnamed protein product [Trichobilharzia szidati]